MEVYFEKNVTNDNIDRHRTRNVIFQVLRIVFIALFIVMLYFNLTYKGFTLEAGVAFLILAIFISLLEIALPLVGIIIFHRLINVLNAEYDYFIVGTTFRVVRVFNRVKRKTFLELPLDSIAMIGLVESESYNRYKADKRVKTINAYCNDNSALGYFYVTRDGDKKLLLLELDKNFIINLKKCLNSTIFDKSVNDFIKSDAEVRK